MALPPRRLPRGAADSARTATGRRAELHSTSRTPKAAPAPPNAHRHANMPQAIQPNSNSARPPAAPVPRPVPTPTSFARAQRPTQYAAQLKPASTARPHAPRPASPLPVGRPQPAPTVLQAKASRSAESPKVSGCASKPSAASMSPRPRGAVGRGASTIQRAADSRWATAVKASYGTVEKVGHSGNGAQTGQLLRSKNTAAARRFHEILEAAGKIASRSGFTCAEPNAVAQVIAAPNGPQTVEQLLQVEIGMAADSTGAKAECPVCSRWIDHGGIVDISASAPTIVSAGGGAPTSTFSLADFIVKKKPRGGKKGGPQPAAAAAAAAATAATPLTPPSAAAAPPAVATTTTVAAAAAAASTATAATGKSAKKSTS